MKFFNLRFPNNPRGKRAFIGAGFLLIAALMSASIFATGPNAEPEAIDEKAWPVSITIVEPQTIHPTIHAYGRVESSNVARIRTDWVAEVAEVLVREGDWVSKGDLLVRLSAREAELQLAERRADLAQHQAVLRSIETEHKLQKQSTSHYESMQRIAQTKLERHEGMMEQRLISQALLDEVIGQANEAHIQYQTHMRAMADFPNRIASQQAQIAKAEALAGQADLNVEKTDVRAPFDGPILSVFVAPGDHSNLGAPLLEMAEAAAFEVRVQVPDAYAERFRQHLADGNEITGIGPNARIMTLTRLASQVQSGQSGLDAFFELPIDDGRPLPALNRLVDVHVTLPSEPDVVPLPVQSIYENDRVYQVIDSRLRALTVDRVGELQGPDGSYHVLVRAPELAAGAQVITTQLPKAISGLLVEPANG